MVNGYSTGRFEYKVGAFAPIKTGTYYRYDDGKALWDIKVYADGNIAYQHNGFLCSIQETHISIAAHFDLRLDGWRAR